MFLRVLAQAGGRSQPGRTANNVHKLGGVFSQSIRNMFINVESTPNPSALKFLPGLEVLPSEYGSSMNFASGMDAHSSPLAKKLFRIEGVNTVMFSQEWISVNIDENAVSWAIVKPQVFAEVMDFFSQDGYQVVTNEPAPSDTQVYDDDTEVVAMIKELLETRIRPSVQDDGGDILFKGFDEHSGIVDLELAGSCTGCPSSSVTLKNGVEKMLMYYIPEVAGVNQINPEEL
jgi:NFU1 iron-sulfur cluster scaffold homolog, mitochondrial